MSSIQVKNAAGSYQYGLHAIKVGGVYLYDYSSIGVDASGRGNNFNDQNFNLNPNNVVYSNGTIIGPALIPGLAWPSAFNGNITDGPSGVGGEWNDYEIYFDTVITGSKIEVLYLASNNR